MSEKLPSIQSQPNPHIMARDLERKKRRGLDFSSSVQPSILGYGAFSNVYCAVIHLAAVGTQWTELQIPDAVFPLVGGVYNNTKTLRIKEHGWPSRDRKISSLLRASTRWYGVRTKSWESKSEDGRKTSPLTFLLDTYDGDSLRYYCLCSIHSQPKIFANHVDYCSLYRSRSVILASPLQQEHIRVYSPVHY